jgi:hypothetical protein
VSRADTAPHQPAAQEEEPTPSYRESRLIGSRRRVHDLNPRRPRHTGVTHDAAGQQCGRRARRLSLAQLSTVSLNGLTAGGSSLV